MGLDDVNEGIGAEECPGHEFVFRKLVLVEKPDRMFPGLGMEMVCRWCGAVMYEASRIENER